MLVDISIPVAKKRVIEACDRLKDELEGWDNYRSLAEQAEASERKACYEEIARQEFEHTLVALGDLLDCLNKKVNDSEKVSLNNFFAQCVKPV